MMEGMMGSNHTRTGGMGGGNHSNTSGGGPGSDSPLLRSMVGQVKDELNQSLEELQAEVNDLERSLEYEVRALRRERPDARAIEASLLEEIDRRIDERVEAVVSAEADKIVEERLDIEVERLVDAKADRTELAAKADRDELAEKADRTSLEEVAAEVEAMESQLSELTGVVERLEHRGTERGEWRDIVVMGLSPNREVLRLLNTTSSAVDLDGVRIIDHDGAEHEVREETIDAYADERVYAADAHGTFAIQSDTPAVPITIRLPSGEEHALHWGTADIVE